MFTILLLPLDDRPCSRIFSDEIGKDSRCAGVDAAAGITGAFFAAGGFGHAGAMAYGLRAKADAVYCIGGYVVLRRLVAFAHAGCSA